jgi:hypothetical protein
MPDHSPAAGVRLFILEDEGVLFSPAAQEIYSLNTAATLAWCMLEERHNADEIASKLAETGAFPATDARNGTANLLAQWRELGLLEGSTRRSPADPSLEGNDASPAPTQAELPPHEERQAVAERRYRLVDRIFRVRFTTSAQLDWVEPVIRHLEIESTDDAGGSARVDEIVDLIEVDGATVIYADRQARWSVPAIDQLAPYVKALLWLSVIAHSPLFLVFHAGVVGVGGRCVMLSAAPGSGKSTLSAALACAGFSFFSDEVALIAEDRFAVRPVPLGLCVKSTGWAVLEPFFPELATARTHHRVDGKIVRYLTPPPGPEQDTYHPVGAIVFPRYAADLETALIPLGKAEALRRLMAECLALRKSLDENNVARLVEWMRAVPCYELPNSSLAEATKLLRQLTASWGSED